MDQETVICTYRVRPGSEDAFIELLAAHWPTLDRLEVVTDDPARVYRSLSEPTSFIELFAWADGGFARAREHPDVLAIWERMEQLCEERNGQPAMEFPHFHELPLAL